MMRRYAVLLLAVVALAQAPAAPTNPHLDAPPVPGTAENIDVTIGIFASSATDPNVDTPVSEKVYGMPRCGFTFVAEGNGPFVDPTFAFFEYPASSGTECRIPISFQVDDLSPGTYKGAVKIDAENYGPLSTTFTKS